MANSPNPPALSALKAARALYQLTLAEALVNKARAAFDDIPVVSHPCGPLNLPFQAKRDLVLQTYLDWKELSDQYNQGLLNFEEFITRINQMMSELELESRNVLAGLDSAT